MLTFREVLIITADKNNLSTYTFPPGKVAQLAKEIQQKYSTVGCFSVPENLETIHNFFLLVEKNDNWESVNPRTWKKACWLLWIGKEPLATSKAFLTKYLEFCYKKPSITILKTLIHIFLRDYKMELPGQFEIAKFIRIQLNTPSFKNRLALWRERDTNYDIFEVNTSFGIKANYYLDGDKQANDFLIDMGLEGTLKTGNFSICLFVALTKEVENKIAHSSNPINLFKKLVNFSVSEEKKLQYPSQKNILIESLLRPWHARTPPAELSRNIIEFLLTYFSDPRTNEGRRIWIGISNESQKTIKKWLAGATLEQFFEIIDNTAEDTHWRYRRAFWKAYYEAGYIDDAWIALGKNSRIEVRSQASLGNELVAADLRGASVKPNHSVLIFKVGELTICEWSHTGACRIWLSTNNLAPSLYENIYLAEQLRTNQDIGIPHQNSSKYGWQYKLAERIEYYTGIKIPGYKF